MGSSFVVPAKAGTHSRGACGYGRWCKGCDELQTAEVMGPGVRRDDSGEQARFTSRRVTHHARHATPSEALIQIKPRAPQRRKITPAGLCRADLVNGDD